jgi:hypothetical protein
LDRRLNSYCGEITLRLNTEVWATTIIQTKEESVAFKNIGPQVFLVPGATVTWNYSYSTDMGPQFACADIKRRGHHRASAVFVADQQGKQLQRNGTS